MIFLTGTLTQVAVAATAALMVGLAAGLVLAAVRRASRHQEESIERLKQDLAELLADFIRNQQLLQDRLDGIQAQLEGLRDLREAPPEIVQCLEELQTGSRAAHQELREAQAAGQAETTAALRDDLGRLREQLTEGLIQQQHRLETRLEALHTQLAAWHQEPPAPPPPADPGSLAAPLRRHQVEAMVKLAEFLSEITTGISEGQIGPGELDDLQQRAIARFHRHGMFLPDGLYGRLQAVLATLLDRGKRFYRPGDGDPEVTPDEAHFQNGACLPQDVFAAASAEGQCVLRIADASLGFIRAIQTELLEDGPRGGLASGLPGMDDLRG
jgi:hypothetical protein